jgi:hypothetical protein
MIDELSPEARALLDAARGGLSPDPAAIHRMRARIGAVSGGAAAAGTALGVKLALIALVVAAGAGVGLYALRARAISATASPAPAPTNEAPVETPRITHAPIQVAIGASSMAVPAGAPPASTVAAPPSLAARMPDALPVAPSRSTTHAGSPSSRTPPADVRSPAAPSRGATAHPSRRAAGPAPLADLAREVELVDLAMAALHRGEPRVALRAVQRHTAETAGRGQLAEDAAAIEIEALCQLHDPATSIKLEAFDARFPRSAQRSRLNSQCR